MSTKRETDAGADVVRILRAKVQAEQDKHDWGKLPADFLMDSIKKLRTMIRPWFRGDANNVIRARIALAKATTHQDLMDAIDKLRPAGSRH